LELILDIGNTRAKIALFDQMRLVEKAILTPLTIEHLKGWVAMRPRPDAAILSSTADESGEIEDWLAELTQVGNRCRFIHLTHETPIPIKNLYDTPHTLGRDRLAGVVAAQHIFELHDVLVIDAGTCVTYNFLNRQSEFLGGSVSPGLDMRLKAMSHFTARLPLVERPEDMPEQLPLIGTDTKTGLQRGAQMGMLAEVEGMIARYARQFADIRVVLTGGSGEWLYQHLESSATGNATVHWEPNLVPWGLHHILHFNLLHGFV
jgi:type III pantothenate kinase